MRPDILQPLPPLCWHFLKLQAFTNSSLRMSFRTFWRLFFVPKLFPPLFKSSFPFKSEMGFDWISSLADIFNSFLFADEMLMHLVNGFVCVNKFLFSYHLDLFSKKKRLLTMMMTKKLLSRKLPLLVTPVETPASPGNPKIKFCGVTVWFRGPMSQTIDLYLHCG